MARVDRSDMKVSLVSDAPVAAPIKKGDVVGKLVISAPGFPGKEVPVIAAQDVEKLGFVGRALAAAKYLVFGADS
jgi:D-alanyl-D-alanine carboxypeptidase (penicillin-binding protein 5/6)